MSWDGFQREVLDALGHRVYALAQAQTQTQRRVQVQEEAGPDQGRRPRPSPTAVPPPPLLVAIARAAGVEVAHLPDLPALERLRGDPGAKRALWPRLRALRRP